MVRAATVPFRALVACLVVWVSWLAGSAVFLTTTGVMGHVEGLFLELCTSVSHVSKDIALLAWAASVVALAAIGALVVVATVLRTRSVVGELTQGARAAGPRVLRLAREAGLSCELRMIDCPEPLVFAHGFVRPAVIVSSAAALVLEDDELRAVLAHEARHVAARDPLRLLLGRLASRVLFPFPVVESLRRCFVLAIELEADRAAIRAGGRKPLASAVLKFVDAPIVGGVAGFSNETVMQVRIGQITGHGAPAPAPFGVRSVAVSLGALAACALTTWAAVRHLPM